MVLVWLRVRQKRQRQRPSVDEVVEIVRSNTSAIPPTLEQKIHYLLNSTMAGDADAACYEAFRTELGSQQLSKFRSIQLEIRNAINVVRYARLQPYNEPSKRAQTYPVLFLFSSNGFEREAAAISLNGSLNNPFEVLTLADLTNNWVKEVREAAIAAIDRTLAETPFEYLVDAAEVILPLAQYWQRWPDETRDRLMGYLANETVITSLANRILNKQADPPDRLLKTILRYPAVDRWLLAMWQDNSLRSTVRSLALNTLLRREARWKTGKTERQWIDKPMGKSRWVPIMTSRPVQFPTEQTELISGALSESKTAVLKVVLQATIEMEFETIEHLERIRELSESPKASVAERAKFILRKHGQS